MFAQQVRDIQAFSYYLIFCFILVYDLPWRAIDVCIRACFVFAPILREIVMARKYYTQTLHLLVGVILNLHWYYKNTNVMHVTFVNCMESCE